MIMLLLPIQACFRTPDMDSHDGLTTISPSMGSILQSQSCNFPKNAWNFPLYATHIWQVPALMSEYLHLPGKYSHTHAISLNNPRHQLKPKADELPFLLLRDSKDPENF